MSEYNTRAAKSLKIPKTGSFRPTAGPSKKVSPTRYRSPGGSARNVTMGGIADMVATQRGYTDNTAYTQHLQRRMEQKQRVASNQYATGGPQDRKRLMDFYTQMGGAFTTKHLQNIHGLYQDGGESMFEQVKPFLMQEGDHIVNNSMGDIGILQEATQMGDQVRLVFQDGRSFSVKGDDHGWSKFLGMDEAPPVSASSAQGHATFREQVEGDDKDLKKKKEKEEFQDYVPDLYDESFEFADDDMTSPKTGSPFGTRRSTSLMHNVGHADFHEGMKSFAKSQGISPGSRVAMYPSGSGPSGGRLPEKTPSFYGVIGDPHPKTGVVARPDKKVDMKPSKFTHDVYHTSPAAKSFTHEIGGKKYDVTVTPPGKTAKDLDPGNIARFNVLKGTTQGSKTTSYMDHLHAAQTKRRDEFSKLRQMPKLSKSQGERMQHLSGQMVDHDYGMELLGKTKQTKTDLSSSRSPGSFVGGVQSTNKYLKERAISHVLDKHPDLTKGDVSPTPHRVQSPGPFKSPEQKKKTFEGLMRPGSDSAAKSERSFQRGVIDSEPLQQKGMQKQTRALDITKHADTLAKSNASMTFHYKDASGYVSHSVESSFDDMAATIGREHRKHGQLPFATVARGNFDGVADATKGASAYKKNLKEGMTSQKVGGVLSRQKGAPGAAIPFKKKEMGKETNRTTPITTQTTTRTKSTMSPGATKTMIVGGIDALGSDVADVVKAGGAYRHGGGSVGQGISDYNQKQQKLFGKQSKKKTEKSSDKYFHEVTKMLK